MHYPHVMLLLLWAAACGDGTPTGDPTPGPNDDTAGGPAEGHWSFTTTLISSTCDQNTTNNGSIDEAGLILERTDYGFMAMLDEPDEQDESTLHCDVIDDAFICDQRSTDFPTDGMDATLTVSEDISGDFPSWTEMEAVVRIELLCAGTDCDTLAGTTDLTLPCQLDLDLVAHTDG